MTNFEFKSENKAIIPLSIFVGKAEHVKNDEFFKKIAKQTLEKLNELAKQLGNIENKSSSWTDNESKIAVTTAYNCSVELFDLLENLNAHLLLLRIRK